MTIENTKKNVLYAVYGTLRKGCGNHYHLKDSNVEFVGHYVTNPVYTLYNIGAFPGLVKKGATSVTLEIYKVNSEKVELSLDALEGYYSDDPTNSMYNKDIIDTPFGPAFIYFWNGDTAQLKGIESGDWIDHIKSVNNPK